MDDARAVMDAVGSERAVVLGVCEGGPMAMLFAATYPERTIGLVLYGTSACWNNAPDYPFSVPAETRHGVRRVRLTEGPALGHEGAGQRVPGGIVRTGHGARRRDAHVARRLHAQRGQPGRGDRVVADEPLDRRALHPPGDPRADPGARSGRRPRLHAGRNEVVGRARSAGPGSSRCRGTSTCSAWGGRRTSSTRSSVRRAGAERGGRPGPDARDGDVHRHRRLDRAGRGARRQGMAGSRGATSRRRAGDARPLPRQGGRHGGGRLLRDVRRAGSRRSMRVGITQAVRDLGIEVRAGVHTGEVETIAGKVGGIAVNVGARIASLAGAVPGARLAHRPGTRRRLGPRVRRRGGARAEGCP